MLRISRDTDESTSIERQREHIEMYCRLHGYVLIDWAEDPGVSGATSPFDREGFGPWLNDPLKMSTYDLVCAWKLDRFGRNVGEFLKLADFLTANGKEIATTDGTVDTTTPHGKFFTTIISAMAEWERGVISMRTKDSRAKLRSLGRWAGGVTPFGFRAVKNLDGEGYVLDTDPENAPIAREIIKRATDGESMNSICVDLNKRGVKSPLGGKWATNTMRNYLRSRRPLGQGVGRDGEVIRGVDGVPTQFGPPLIEKRDWDRLQGVLDTRAKPKEWARKGKPGLVSRIAYCAKCGEKMYIKRRGDRPDHPGYYWCRTTTCERQSVRADRLDRLVSHGALLALWRLPELERQFIPGVDHTTQLAEAEEARDYLIAQSASRAGSAREPWERQIAAQEERVAWLAAMPRVEAHYDYVPTGRTYGDAWRECTDEIERGDLLRKTGLRVFVLPFGLTRWSWPDDLAAQMKEGNRPRRGVEIERFAQGLTTRERVLMRGTTIEATTTRPEDALDLLQGQVRRVAEYAGDADLLALFDA